MKNDRIRSSLIELQSVPLSKIDVDPIHSVLMLTCTRISCGDSHRENGSFEVLSLHTTNYSVFHPLRRDPPGVVFNGHVVTRTTM